MEEETLQKYLHQIQRLKRSASNGGAPHKPILFKVEAVVKMVYLDHC